MVSEVLEGVYCLSVTEAVLNITYTPRAKPKAVARRKFRWHIQNSILDIWWGRDTAVIVGIEASHINPLYLAETLNAFGNDSAAFDYRSRLNYGRLPFTCDVCTKSLPGVTLLVLHIMNGIHLLQFLNLHTKEHKGTHRDIVCQ